MKEIVERILKAETDAKSMEREAREQGRRILEEARKEAAGIVGRAREAAREDARRELDSAREAARVERTRILDEAESRAKALLGNAVIGDYAVIAQAVRKVSGLEQ